MDFEKMSESEILDIANPIMDNLMEASTRIDHERHIRDFTDRMKKIGHCLFNFSIFDFQPFPKQFIVKYFNSRSTCLKFSKRYFYI